MNLAIYVLAGLMTGLCLIAFYVLITTHGKPPRPKQPIFPPAEPKEDPPFICPVCHGNRWVPAPATALMSFRPCPACTPEAENKKR